MKLLESYFKNNLLTFIRIYIIFFLKTFESLLKFDDKEGKEIYWHSSAHILGECMERYFGGALCYGPDIEDGFYYDMWMGPQSVSSEADMPKLEKLYNQMMKEKQPFEVIQRSIPIIPNSFRNFIWKMCVVRKLIKDFLWVSNTFSASGGH